MPTIYQPEDVRDALKLAAEAWDRAVGEGRYESVDVPVSNILRDLAACDTEPTLRELQAQVGVWTIQKGWRDDRTVGDLLMLMVSELAEAMEEWRNWHEPNDWRVDHGKPEGIPVELADVVIRILSFCAKFDINLQQAVLDKMAFNETRPHRHGGKRV